MRKILTALAPLRRIRPRRRVHFVALYLLFVLLMIGAITWRAMSVNPITVTPPQDQTWQAMEAGPVIPVPDISPDLVEDVEIIEGLLEDEEVFSNMPKPRETLGWPLEGEILTGHHEVYRIGSQTRLHVGVDLAAPPDSLVAAVWPGVVYDVREDARYGLLMEIYHGGGYLSQYANLDDTFFAVGEEVHAGEAVARVGATAALDAAEGHFLHFAFYLDGRALDPVQELSPSQ